MVDGRSLLFGFIIGVLTGVILRSLPSINWFLITCIAIVIVLLLYKKKMDGDKK